MVNVIETFQDSPKGMEACEDRLVISPDFIAVLDGAGHHMGKDGRTCGWHAAQAVADVLKVLPAQSDAFNFVEMATQALSRLLSDEERQDYRAATQAVVYSCARREIWRVGDSHFRIGDAIFIGDKAVDGVGAAYRCAVLRAMLRAGTYTQTDLLEENTLKDRPWRALAGVQGFFQNLDDPTEPLAYGVLDGMPVPSRFVQMVSVPVGSSVVLCTDGFFDPAPTLEEGLSALKTTKARDPLLIYTREGSRPFWKGGDLFDDTTYVRFET